MYALNSFDDLIDKKMIYVNENNDGLTIVTEGLGVLYVIACTQDGITMHHNGQAQMIVQGIIFQEISYALYQREVISLEEHRAYMKEYPQLLAEWENANKGNLEQIPYGGLRKIR